MSEAKTDVIDPLEDFAFRSWLQIVKGTWSKSDAEIYVAGFKAGWMERGRVIREAVDGGGDGAASSVLPRR